jgi:hypothetical protein
MVRTIMVTIGEIVAPPEIGARSGTRAATDLRSIDENHRTIATTSVGVTGAADA